jgi:hypothetical protein
MPPPAGPRVTGIAAFLYTGLLLEHVVYDAFRGMYWLMPTLVLVCGLRTWMAYRLDRISPRDVMPAERLRNHVPRIFFLVVLMPVAIWAIADLWRFWAVAPAIDMAAYNIDMLAFAITFVPEYFMACRRRPPRRQHAPAPSNAVRNAA